MVTHEQELKNRHNDMVEGKIRFWRQKVEDGQKIIERAGESLEYSQAQLESWRFFLARPSDSEQLLLNLPVRDLLTYGYKFTA